FRRKPARFFLQHHRDAVLHRIAEAIGLADELGRVFAIDELALAQRAHQDFKQLWIDGTHRASESTTRRTPQRPPLPLAPPTRCLPHRGAILQRPPPSSAPAPRPRSRGPRA